MNQPKKRKWFPKFGKGQPKISMVNNKNAGKNTSRAGYGSVIAAIIANLPYHTVVYDTETLGEMRAAVEEIRINGTGIFMLNGGDGTLQETITAHLQLYENTPYDESPPIFYPPTGTMQIVANSIGLTRYPSPQLTQRVCAKIVAGEPFDIVNVNVLKINGEYGFLYGAGLPVHYLNHYYDDGDNRGPERAAKVAFSTLWNELIGLLPFRKAESRLTKPVHGKIILPDSHEPSVGDYMSHTALMVSTINQIGFGCRGMPNAMSQPGNFMLRSTQLSFLGLMVNLPSLFAGGPLMRTFDAVTNRIEIEWDKPTVIQIDGEIKEPRMKDVIECGPSLKFIVG